MRIVLTGSSGRVGRAIFSALTLHHSVVGVDRTPFATTHVVGDITDKGLLERAMEGADAVIHTAALHAPHVGLLPDDEFERINVSGTQLIADIARMNGVRRLIFTSSTAVYGKAIVDGGCTWVDEHTSPEPETIYHRTKLAAEDLLEKAASDQLAVRVMRMSRCFPQTADLMAVYRLHRGVDARDVADAHVLALKNEGPCFQRFIVSGSTPFTAEDCEALATDAAAVLENRAPALAAVFKARGWHLPKTIDRVYTALATESALGWKARLDFAEVLAQLDRKSLEVLPVGADVVERSE